MKKLILIVFMSSLYLHSKAQDLPIVFINDSVSTHFVLSEPVQYVDISTAWVNGDLPLENIVRIKPNRPDSLAGTFAGVVTIACEKYMTQYQMVYTSAAQATKNIRISSLNSIGLLGSNLSREELRSLSQNAERVKPAKIAKSKAHGMVLKLNNVFTVEDYIFIDLTLENTTNIPYDIDLVRFRVEDMKAVKSTNFQMLEVQPEFTLFNMTKVKSRQRNIFVFKKFTFPDEKIFTVEFSEKMISGRMISLKVNYKDILKAKSLESY